MASSSQLAPVLETEGSSPRSQTPVRPAPTAIQGTGQGRGPSESTLRQGDAAAPSTTKKRKNHRGKRKPRQRRQSFAPSDADDGSGLPGDRQGDMTRASQSAARDGFYRVRGRHGSNTSVDSEALLDHRDIQPMRARRSSNAQPFGSPSYRQSYSNPFMSGQGARPRTAKSGTNTKDDGDDEDGLDERAPLISATARAKSSNNVNQGTFEGQKSKNASRRPSSRSSRSSEQHRTIFDRPSPHFPDHPGHNVNNPPSVPASPVMGAVNMSFSGMNYADELLRDEFGPGRASPTGMDEDEDDYAVESITDKGRSVSPTRINFQGRRHTVVGTAEDDVCFPVDDHSDMADDDAPTRRGESASIHSQRPRRRRRRYPDLACLDEWSRVEKESRNEERKVRTITEPQLVGGRLRPIHKGWHRAEDDAPYRFTYFNEAFESTVHSASISELVQPGSSFRDLFIPDRVELSDSSSSESEGEGPQQDASYLRHVPGLNGESRVPTRQGSVNDRPESRRSQATATDNGDESRILSGDATPVGQHSPMKSPQPKASRLGERPTWWLDVLSPTEQEMKVLSRTFGIHPLTVEDIMQQEAREKVELFRNYYFVNYRSFEQDQNHEEYLEAVNMYIIVFREGIMSFHFSQTPHPANVRRRIRQLKDYLSLSSDWISYAIIDDITDVFAPLIQSIEDEVDDIDAAILQLHSPLEEEKEKRAKDDEKASKAGDATSGSSGSDMLRRVGDCRKKVMGLYRLLGNKADVIKGFAKRCNEHWEVAPRSEIGLYLGDIQDHIVTMTGNLSHYEKILARSHGNYLAQINIRMNERQEQTADVLGKLTVLGTIVLPMNIITGLWGMNVWVPGQEYEGNLAWFWCLTGGLLMFGLCCYLIAKKVYGIV